MQGSTTLKAAAAAAALRASGADVINLTVGEPDFETPQFVKDHAIEALNHGVTRYTPSAGLKILQESICRFYGEQFGASLEPSEVAAACGGKQAIFNAVCAVVDAGDEVILPKPYWVSFPEMVNFCGGTNVFIDTEETDLLLTADQVRAAITDKTKLLIVNSPNNPSGRVIAEDELLKIFELCAEKGVYVITDECYLFFVYPPAKVFTSASLSKEMRQNICVAGSFSKTFAMTGWRSGYTIADPAWTKAMVKLQSHSATHPTSFVQYACAKALDDADKALAAVAEMTAEYKRRRDYFVPALNGLKGVSCTMPDGAFYAFIDVREMLGGELKTSADVTQMLLEKAHIVGTDGEGFGSEGFIRLSYATSMENLENAIKRLGELLGTK